MMKFSLKLALTFSFIFIFDSLINATEFFVGPTYTYTTPNQLYLANENSSISILNGDTINIVAGLYEGTPGLAVWHADSLLIRGINGRPHLKANGAYIWQKAIWVAAGDYITVENIEFSEASVPDHNGAGIRLDGIGLTVRYCYFHDNEDGILTSNPYAGNILVEHSEFNHNGYGDGYSHNIYVGHVESFTLRFCYMHHAFIGHNVKTRAENNYILYNRIMDEYSGQSSFLLDIPNGGFSLVIGNLFMQGENAENKTLVNYGAEGISNASSELYVVNNTMVNERVTGIFVNAHSGTTVAKIRNNVMLGTGDMWIGATDTANNFYFVDTIGTGLTDPVNFNYHLNSNSQLINAGSDPGFAAGIDLSPAYEYVHPEDSISRQQYNNIDVGAYEFPQSPTEVQTIEDKARMMVYPNPAKHFVKIENRSDMKIIYISLINAKGKLLQNIYPDNKSLINIDLSAFPTGYYWFSIVYKEGVANKKFCITR
ncbi:MAG: T9SS type A sorting domain-containing protein [Bacteroidota bacterium]|nr:T9SS type A sorting domain-containing protein [Bacteroidota bacterium]